MYKYFSQTGKIFSNLTEEEAEDMIIEEYCDFDGFVDWCKEANMEDLLRTRRAKGQGYDELYNEYIDETVSYYWDDRVKEINNNKGNIAETDKFFVWKDKEDKRYAVETSRKDAFNLFILNRDKENDNLAFAEWLSEKCSALDGVLYVICAWKNKGKEGFTELYQEYLAYLFNNMIDDGGNEIIYVVYEGSPIPFDEDGKFIGEDDEI